MRKIVLMVITLILLGLSFSLTFIVPVKADSTQIAVINPLTGDSNFVFYDNSTSVGTCFNASIWVSDVTDLFAFQIGLCVDDSVLTITRIWLPTNDPQWVFKDKTIVTAKKLFDDDLDGYTEAVLTGTSLLDKQTAFQGTGLLAIIELQIIRQPTEGENLTCTLKIDNLEPFGTYLLDSSISVIPTVLINGQYTYFDPPSPIIGDINNDKKIDIRDIALVAICYGQTVPPAPPDRDVTGPIFGVPDGKIDIRDIAVVAKNFGKTLP